MDEYISLFPKPIQEILENLRSIVKKIVPQAQEAIIYGIPTFKLHGNLVHFAAFQHHIGFYPTASGISNFSKELASYKHAKGSVQFPLDKPIPYDLIKKIIEFRVKENIK